MGYEAWRLYTRSPEGEGRMDHEEVGRYWDENAEVWTELVRAGYDHYRDGLNTPAFLEMLPDVRPEREANRSRRPPTRVERSAGSGRRSRCRSC
jgi:hypothetical protein